MAEIDPGLKLTQIANGFQAAKVLFAAVELEVFSALKGGAKTAAELAEQGALELRGIEILLDALVAMGLLHKDDGRYENLPEYAPLLDPESPRSQVQILKHRNHTLKQWALLEDTIRGALAPSIPGRQILSDPAANRAFILGMAEVSRPRLGLILDALPLEHAARMIDLGGGPAQYLCEAVRRFPRLRGQLVDLPLTVAVAKEQIALAGLAERVTTVVSDFYREPALELGEAADVVLVSQVLHAEGPEQNAALLKKVRPWVRPGGTLAIVENLVADDRSTPAEGAFFAVNMLAGTERGRTYTAGEIAQWLRAAGFAPESARELAPRTTLIAARPL